MTTAFIVSMIIIGAFIIICAVIFFAQQHKIKHFKEHSFDYFVDFLIERSYYCAMTSELFNNPIDPSVRTIEEYRTKCADRDIPPRDYVINSIWFQNAVNGLQFWARINDEWIEYQQTK
jgi:hypothetical protein